MVDFSATHKGLAPSEQGNTCVLANPRGRDSLLSNSAKQVLNMSSPTNASILAVGELHNRSQNRIRAAPTACIASYDSVERDCQTYSVQLVPRTECDENGGVRFLRDQRGVSSRSASTLRAQKKQPEKLQVEQRFLAIRGGMQNILAELTWTCRDCTLGTAFRGVNHTKVTHSSNHALDL